MITVASIKQVLTALKRFRSIPRLAPKEDGSEDYACTAAGMEAACKRAVDAGLTPVLGDDCTLTLDFDDDREINAVVLAKLIQLWGEPIIKSWRSKSGHGHHVTVQFRKAPPSVEAVRDPKDWQTGGSMPFQGFSEAQAIALECALGSDPMRTLFGVARLQENVERPRVLFKPNTAVHEHDFGSTDDTARVEQPTAA